MTSGAKVLTSRATAPLSAPAPPPIGAGIVSAFVASFERLGYDTKTLLTGVGVDAALLRNPDALIPCQQFGALICAAQSARPMRNLMLHLAAATPIGAFPLLDYLILTSGTVGEGLTQLARFLRLFGNATQVGVHLDESPPRVTLDHPGNASSVEFTAVLAVLHLREETEGRFSPIAVHFAHQPEDVQEFSKILRVPVIPGSTWSGFQLSPEAAKLPLRRRDPTLHGVLENAAKGLPPAAGPSDLASDLRRAMAARLMGGDLRVQSVARALGTTSRTLQRRLAESGLSYNGMLDAMRRDAAAQYLAGESFSVGEIAYLLGYSEPAAFHRAFRRWHGVTPAAYRMKNDE